MSKSFHPLVRQIVGKLNVSASEGEAADFFWSKVKGRGSDMTEEQWEKFDKQARECHRENVSMYNRVMSGQIG
jgi:hypothetical protein